MKIIILLQGNVILLFLYLESLIICFSEFELIFEIWAGSISFSLIYKWLRAIARLLFHKHFPIIYLWGKIYYHLVIFIYKWFNIWNSFLMWFNLSIIKCNCYHFYHLNFCIYCCFFLFYPVWRISKWTTTSKIYDMNQKLSQK